MQFTGWCLDKEDLCVVKLCAFREKDQNFVYCVESDPGAWGSVASSLRSRRGHGEQECCDEQAGGGGKREVVAGEGGEVVGDGV